MLNLSNVLSFSRAGLALAFLTDSTLIRFLAILMAMLTDSLDGFIARKRGVASQFGAILDPIMDKFFVVFVAGILFTEHRLASWQLVTLLSRDIALCLFGIYLFLVKSWKEYECKSIFWGKSTTALQFVVLLALTVAYRVPAFVYLIFVGTAIGAFIELMRGLKLKAPSARL